MPRPGPRPYECIRRAWHSDTHQPMRGTLIHQIFRLVGELHSPSTKKKKEFQEKLPTVVLRSEEILYSKANSEAEYMDAKTLRVRLDDAVNTIIRREETEESGGTYLQPCVEAALLLGCVPKKSSRGQKLQAPLRIFSGNSSGIIDRTSAVNSPIVSSHTSTLLYNNNASASVSVCASGTVDYPLQCWPLCPPSPLGRNPSFDSKCPAETHTQPQLQSQPFRTTTSPPPPPRLFAETKAWGEPASFYSAFAPSESPPLLNTDLYDLRLCLGPPGKLSRSASTGTNVKEPLPYSNNTSNSSSLLKSKSLVESSQSSPPLFFESDYTRWFHGRLSHEKPFMDTHPDAPQAKRSHFEWPSIRRS